MEINSEKWSAYSYLREQKIPADSISAGFEINCWNEGRLNWWYEFTDLKKFPYLIQFRQPKGYVKMKQYPFNRTFPPKTDTINIFVKRRILPGALTK